MSVEDERFDVSYLRYKPGPPPIRQESPAEFVAAAETRRAKQQRFANERARMFWSLGRYASGDRDEAAVDAYERVIKLRHAGKLSSAEATLVRLTVKMSYQNDTIV